MRRFSQPNHWFRPLAAGVTALLILASGSLLAQAPSQGLLREVFENIGNGTAISDLTSHPSFPDNPSSTGYLPLFEAPTDVAEQYGQRLRGFIIPPETGNYVFWIASDDASVLYLSTDEEPANKKSIATVNSWTSSRQWGKEPNQQSEPIHLEADRRYYVEALMKEGGGGDNLAVRWQLPNGSMEEPIPGAHLLPFGIAFTPPDIKTQPQDLTVMENDPASFTVRVNNLDPVSYQWQKDQADIPGATSPTYTLPNVPLSANNAAYRVRLENSLGTTFSEEAILTVTPDTVRPTVVQVQNIGPDSLAVVFSEPVSETTALKASNYTLDQGATVDAASFAGDSRSVLLTTSSLTFGTTYTLTISGVQDTAVSPNTILSPTQIEFKAVEYTPFNIGAATGSATPASGGLDITSTGTNLSSGPDQLHFSYQQRLGDFDMKVRVASLKATGPWARAGLMARQNLEANSPFAAVFATPSLSGIIFQSRSSTGAPAATDSDRRLPVNYPDTWLRLKRQGNTFTGYASLNGQEWVQVSSKSLDLPNEIFFGFAVSSSDPAVTTTAQFRDTQLASGGSVIKQFSLPHEPLGPSSRSTGLVISEIMYHPAGAGDPSLEFIEIFNADGIAADLSRFRLSGDVDYDFPDGTILPSGAFLVVAKDPAALTPSAGSAPVLGPFQNELSNRSGRVRLRNRSDALLLDVEYSDEAPWPVAADGAGHSLILGNPSYGETDPRAWTASNRIGGSPGHADGFPADPLRPVVINEILAHTDNPQLDYIELYNRSALQLDISGTLLSDSRNPETGFIIPEGTLLPPGGFISFDQNELGFALSSSGETVYFINPDRTRVLDVLRFDSQENDVPLGRFPDGSSDFSRLAAKTPGAANAPALISPLVINELMYHPISDLDEDEYLELYNHSSEAIDLSGWRFVDGIRFTFPEGTVLAENSFLVLAKDAAHLQSQYAQLNNANTIGNYGGTLSNSGERVALAKPDWIVSTNQTGQVVTNLIHIVVDEVRYRDGGRWGLWSDGDGSSLELINPAADRRYPSNWADSDETGKSRWTTVEHTGRLDLGRGDRNEIQLMLLGGGQALVDDIEVISSGNNTVPNGTFESGLTGWVIQGNHVHSSLESREGFNSNRSLHLRASSGGDNGANRVEADLSTAIPDGSTATIRAQARWLRGNPHLLLRLHGNHLEASGKMEIPKNLGSPSLRNSAYRSNQGPALTGLQHSPVLPAAREDVTVTVQATDPDGVAQVLLKYRVDPSASFATRQMKDDGLGRDQIAGDGVFTAAIPGQSGGTLIAFYIEATDSTTPSATTTYPATAPASEALVMFGESMPPGNIPVYRLWMTQANLDEWTRREKLSNQALPGTLVYNDYRVIHNASARYRGSPWIRPGYSSPTSSLTALIFNTPDDDLLFGEDEFNLDTLEPGKDDTRQREKMSFWIADRLDAPFSFQRYIHVYLAGSKRGVIYTDSQQPNADLIQRWFPGNDDGHIFKIDDWFEFDDSVNKQFNIDATLEDFTTTSGVKKQARYRWNWERKSNRGLDDDYSKLFELVDAMNAQGSAYTDAVTSLVDIDQWVRIFGTRHIVADWDGYGYNRGKNQFAYKVPDGKWHMLLWDLDFSLGGGSSGTNSDLFSSNDPVIRRFYSHPPFRRAYWQTMLEAVNGPLRNENADPVMDETYAYFQANGLTQIASPGPIKSWIADRRNYIESQLNSVDSPFAITSNNGSDFSTSENLLTLSGAAPIAVSVIEVNGVHYQPTWTTENNWTIQLALSSGLNALSVRGLDRHGQPVADASDTIQVTYTGAEEHIQDAVVISEIMYHPAEPGGAYVEIHNTSSQVAFDLSGVELNGADFTFPDGTLITPGSFLIVAGDAVAFAGIYGPAIPVAGEFNGRLANNGETLSLILRGDTPDQDLTINQVTYSNQPPWPLAADGAGPSLQLVDPSRDNNRAGNWRAAADSNEPPPPDQELVPINQVWSYNQDGIDLGTQWRSMSYDDTTWPSGSALLYVEDSPLPAPKNTELTIGSLTYYFRTEFEFIDNPARVSLELSTVIDDGLVLYLNGQEIYRLGMPTGEISYQTTAARTVREASLEGPVTLPASALRNGRNVLAAEVHQTGPGSSDVVFGLTLTSRGSQLALGTFTPGAPNSVAASLPPFPALRLNELLAQSGSTSLQDNAGERDPWVELHHSGASDQSLDALVLSDDSANLAKWTFPSGASLAPDTFALVWLDGHPAQNNATDWHANFTPSPEGGILMLSHLHNDTPIVIDHITYPALDPGLSFGLFPDSDIRSAAIFQTPTPAAPNSLAVPAVDIKINEWMASNATFMTDPADGAFDDWFELYNPGSEQANLTGYTLTDDLSQPAKWTIPNGVSIPAGGFLLFWADEDGSQNTGPDSLHTNFKLSRSGESIGLYAPDGALVDSIQFGAQTTDWSEGRLPDGAAPPFSSFSIPTPGASNSGQTGANQPPAIAPMEAVTVDEGTFFERQAVATDPDEGQTLHFALTAAPGGAQIDPQTGLITWIPSEAQGPDSYTLQLTVTDNGSPSLSSTASLAVQVAEVNLPPVLATIQDQTAAAGQTVEFIAQAADPDLPANTVQFTLETAPTGASIDANTGRFTWDIPAGTSAGEHQITVIATDNASPALSDQAQVRIVVSETPVIQIEEILLDQGQVTLRWTSLSGTTYQVQSTPDLSGGQWSDVGDPVTASGTTSQTTANGSPIGDRFYRIRTVE